MSNLLKQLDERWKVSKHEVYSQEFDVFAELDFELKTDLKVENLCMAPFLANRLSIRL